MNIITKTQLGSGNKMEKIMIDRYALIYIRERWHNDKKLYRKVNNSKTLLFSKLFLYTFFYFFYKLLTILVFSREKELLKRERRAIKVNWFRKYLVRRWSWMEERNWRLKPRIVTMRSSTLNKGVSIVIMVVSLKIMKWAISWCTKN